MMGERAGKVLFLIGFLEGKGEEELKQNGGSITHNSVSHFMSTRNCLKYSSLLHRSTRKCKGYSTVILREHKYSFCLLQHNDSMLHYKKNLLLLVSMSGL